MTDASLSAQISPPFTVHRGHDERHMRSGMSPPTETVADGHRPRLLSADTVGPVALALFAYAGQIKLSPLLSWVPVDLTLLLGLVVAVAVLASRLRRGPTSGAIAIPISLLAVLQLGVLQSSLDGYALTKVITLWTFTTLAVLAPFYVLRTEAQRRLFLGTLVTLASVIAVVTIISPTRTNTVTNVAVFEGTNTIGTARMAGTGVVICLILMIAARVSAGKRAMLAVLSVVLVAIALGAGSRGPFLAIGVGIFAALITSPTFSLYRGRAVLAAGVLGGAAVAWVATTNSDGLTRVFDFLAGQQDTSTQARSFFWSTSLHYITSSPTGIGWGNFARLPGMSVYADATGAQYSHNLILEAFLEGGWLVGVAVLLYLVVSIVRVGRFSTDATSAAIYALLVFSAFNAMVSGDINDSRLLWMLLSCAWLIKRPRAAHSDREDAELTASVPLTTGV
jgi:hypothetical protein